MIALRIRAIAALLFCASILCAQPRPATKQAAASSQAFSTLAAQADAARRANAPEAAVLYERALAIRPSWKEGWWTLGSLHYEHDRYPQCRDAFQRLTAVDPKSGPAFTMLGLCEFGAKQYDASLAALRRGQQLGVASPALNEVARYHLAMLLTRAGDFENALGILLELEQAGKEKPAYVILSGLAGLWKPMLPEDLPPDERELVLLAGRAFCDAAVRNVPAAKKSFEILLAKYPSTPGVHYLYGSFALVEDQDHALAAFEDELKISPNHVGALSAIAAEYLRREDPAKGIPYARKCVELLPDGLACHAILGRLLADNGDLQGGAKELETAQKLGPNDPQPRIALASIYAKLGRQEDAARERREFLRIKSQNKAPGEQ
jgi:tetratricopeptide (TPR) repeat protein